VDDADWLIPEWPYANRVQVMTTTRAGGASLGPYRSFNLADHVADEPDRVASNRKRLQRSIGERPVQWLQQVHGTRVIRAGSDSVKQIVEADAAWTDEVGLALAVLTADCLPVVVVDESFTGVAIIHAGWRGLVDGILGKTLASFPFKGCFAWIGPAIGPSRYQVGAEVLDRVEGLGSVARGVIQLHGSSDSPDRSARKGYLDLFKLAEQQLHELGVEEVYCERLCTWEHADLYSYRRDGITGRMASMVWLVD
jgi:YfiH family protein